MAVDTQAPQANPLKTVFDTIVAPKEAFESIRLVPTWGWALAIGIVLSVAGTYLLAPALQHAMAAEWPATVAKSPQLAQMTPAQQQAQLAVGQKVIGFSWVFVLFALPIFALVQALVMLVFDKIGHGEGTFTKYFAAVANISVPASLGPVVAGVIATLRGPNSFESMSATQTAMPTLALLAPGASPKLAAFLGVMTPFSLWATGLVIAAMLIVGRVGKIPAWLAGLVLLIVPALFATIGK